MLENTTTSTELHHDFCTGIGPLQLGVVLVLIIYWSILFTCMWHCLLACDIVYTHVTLFTRMWHCLHVCDIQPIIKGNSVLGSYFPTRCPKWIFIILIVLVEKNTLDWYITCHTLWPGPPLGGDILTKCQGPLSPKGPLSQGLRAQNCDVACGGARRAPPPPPLRQKKTGRPPQPRAWDPKMKPGRTQKGPLSRRFGPLNRIWHLSKSQSLRSKIWIG